MRSPQLLPVPFPSPLWTSQYLAAKDTRKSQFFPVAVSGVYRRSTSTPGESSPQHPVTPEEMPHTAHYEEVGGGNTGHAESVRIVYDPAQITYGQILMIFFSVAHNPTELNKQGPDWGTQYRSSVFYTNEAQQKIATAYIAQLDAAKIYSQKIVTQVVPLNGFYPAESYHQDYVKHHPDNPYIAINDLPKLANLKKQFPELYREN